MSTTDWSGRLAPSLDDFETLARTVFEALPDEFRTMAGEISVAIADFPDEDVLDAMQAETAFDLLGLFQGVGLAHAPAAGVTGLLPNRIWLYRRPILDYWAEHEEPLGGIVTHVLVHEIGHHFGLSDDDMAAIESAVE